MIPDGPSFGDKNQGQTSRIAVNLYIRLHGGVFQNGLHISARQFRTIDFWPLRIIRAVIPCLSGSIQNPFLDRAKKKKKGVHCKDFGEPEKNKHQNPDPAQNLKHCHTPRGSTRVNVYNNSTRQSAPLEVHTAHDDHLLPLNILASCIFLSTHLLTIVIPFQATHSQHGKRPLFSGRTQVGEWEHRSRSQPGLAPGFLHCVGVLRHRAPVQLLNVFKSVDCPQFQCHSVQQVGSVYCSL